MHRLWNSPESSPDTKGPPLSWFLTMEAKAFPWFKKWGKFTLIVKIVEVKANEISNLHIVSTKIKEKTVFDNLTF